MTDYQPRRRHADLADIIEMLLDKGVVINADIAVSIGDTQLLGIQVRAAIASFETAAKYGLEFPEGTDMRQMAEAVDDPSVAEMDRPRVPIDPVRGVNVTSDEETDDEDRTSGDPPNRTESDGETDQDEGNGLLGGDDRGTERLGARPDPDLPTEGGLNMIGDDGGASDRPAPDAEGDEPETETDSSGERDADAPSDDEEGTNSDATDSTEDASAANEEGDE